MKSHSECQRNVSPFVELELAKAKTYKMDDGLNTAIKAIGVPHTLQFTLQFTL